MTTPQGPEGGHGSGYGGGPGPGSSGGSPGGSSGGTYGGSSGGDGEHGSPGSPAGRPDPTEPAPRDAATGHRPEPAADRPAEPSPAPEPAGRGDERPTQDAAADPAGERATYGGPPGPNGAMAARDSDPGDATATMPAVPSPAPGGALSAAAVAAAAAAGGTAASRPSAPAADQPRRETPPEPRPEPKTAPKAEPNPAAAQPLKSGKTRRARLVVRRVDPWSVLKFSLLFSLCLLIVFVVAVAALYYALESLGVFESVNQFVRDVTQAGPEGRPTGGFDVTFSPEKVIGGAAVIGAINVVIITAISTLGAFLYNLCADIVGGIEVTLAERD